MVRTDRRLFRTWTDWDAASKAIGFTDGRSTRVQGGLRVGTSFDYHGVRVEPTLTGMAYDDVSISGGTIVSAFAPLVPTDEGKVFGQGIGKLNFDWGRGLSAYVEGEVRGPSGVLGYAGP